MGGQRRPIEFFHDFVIVRHWAHRFGVSFQTKISHSRAQSHSHTRANTHVKTILLHKSGRSILLYIPYAFRNYRMQGSMELSWAIFRALANIVNSVYLSMSDGWSDALGLCRFHHQQQAQQHRCPAELVTNFILALNRLEKHIQLFVFGCEWFTALQRRQRAISCTPSTDQLYVVCFQPPRIVCASIRLFEHFSKRLTYHFRNTRKCLKYLHELFTFVVLSLFLTKSADRKKGKRESKKSRISFSVREFYRFIAPRQPKLFSEKTFSWMIEFVHAWRRWK